MAKSVIPIGPWHPLQEEPEFFMLTVDGETVVDQGLLIACDGVHAPAEFAGFNTVSVITVDFSEGLSSSESVGVIADGAHDIRVAFAGVEENEVPELFQTLARAAREL